jgi:hypothetical protein
MRLPAEGRNRLRAAAKSGTSVPLISVIAPHALATAFAGKRLLDTFLLPGLQIEGVSLDFLDDVFLLNSAFKPTQSIF